MNDDAGFTLIETLAVLVAGSLLLAGIGWFVGSLGDELRRSTTTRIEQITRVEPVLRRLLEAAQPAAGGSILRDAWHLRFKTSAPLALQGAGSSVVALSVEERREGTALIAEVEPVIGREELPSSLLLERMRDIRFERRGTGEAQQIALMVSAGRGDDWTLLFSPRVNSAGGCRFDPISLACR